MKVILRGVFIALNTYIKKMERSNISNLRENLKTLEWKEIIIPKSSIWQEIIKSGCNQLREKQKKLQRIKEAKNWFLGKINKIDNYLCKLIKKQREVLINKIRNGRWPQILWKLRCKKTYFKTCSPPNWKM